MTVASELDERIGKCQKILDADPNSQIFAALAEAFRKKGELDRAFRVCQAGLRIHPSYAAAHVVMAKINLDRGLYDWAEAEAKKAIDLEGTSRATELLLAEVYIYRGEFPQAIKLLSRLADADPDNEQIQKLLDIAQRLPEEQAIPATPDPEPTMVSAAEGGEVSEEPDEAGLTARQVIRDAVTMRDVHGVMFINGEGLLVESDWSLGLDPNVCAATMAELDRNLTSDLVAAQFGSGQSILVEAAGPILYLVHVAGGMFLFACDQRINLGTLRMKIAALVDRYQAA